MCLIATVIVICTIQIKLNSIEFIWISKALNAIIVFIVSLNQSGTFLGDNLQWVFPLKENLLISHPNVKILITASL